MYPTLTVKELRLEHDCSRVIVRLLAPEPSSRVARIIKRVTELDTAAANKLLTQIGEDFSSRHKDLPGIFARHYGKVKNHVPRGTVLDQTQRDLVGAYFTMEYSIEAAALFNPSIVAHPDQSGLEKGCLRFIMSLRATGEGHISSVEFRTGILTESSDILLDSVGRHVCTQNVLVNPVYDRHLFELKLNEMDTCNEITAHVLEHLPRQFTYKEMKNCLEAMMKNSQFSKNRRKETREIMFWLANSNYAMDFDPATALSERVIFPVSENESCGIEDARFVRFVDDSGEVTYYATYTAYNGITILPQLIETRDFCAFNVMTLNGNAVKNKGMALFPRKIGGNFVMLSRQDGENNSIMFSDNLHFWQKSEILQTPMMPWEFLQIGNCGAPLETSRGWLVLTHGVGPMRKYCISAILLDLDNPRIVIGRLNEPILSPREADRNGYVPNVVYTCGALIHGGSLVVPYAMSDTRIGVATVAIEPLLQSMLPG